jgi:hypothetical protein
VRSPFAVITFGRLESRRWAKEANQSPRRSVKETPIPSLNLRGRSALSEKSPCQASGSDL